jgi:hypothetical protein
VGVRVEVRVEEATVGGRPGVAAECLECGEQVECRGTTERSVKRCLAMLRENCPQDAGNYYVEQGGDE